MALKSYALTTVDRFKSFADINTADDNDLLEILVNAVTEFVENYCSRRFKLTTYTNKEIDSDGSHALFLDEYPVDEDTGLTLSIRNSGVNEDDWDSIDSEDYFVNYGAGIIKIAGGKWIKGIKKYRATYKAGYDFNNTTTFLSDTAAGDVEIAAWQLVNAVYNKRRGDPNIESEKIGSYSVKFSRELWENADIRAILDKYKKKDDPVGAMGPNLY
jgi:hypothetical protein